MTPTIAELAVSPEEFARAVAEMRAAPYGHTLAAIKLHISDAKAELKPHMNLEYAAARLAELAMWMGELRRWELANEAAKLRDWVPVREDAPRAFGQVSIEQQ